MWRWCIYGVMYLHDPKHAHSLANHSTFMCQGSFGFIKSDFIRDVVEEVVQFLLLVVVFLEGIFIGVVFIVWLWGAVLLCLYDKQIKARWTSWRDGNTNEDKESHRRRMSYTAIDISAHSPAARGNVDLKWTPRWCSSEYLDKKECETRGTFVESHAPRNIPSPICDHNRHSGRD